MSYKKGMSQTLALIVAASVLMMTALTVIMMTQGGLQDTFSSSNRQSCLSTIESTCEFSGSGPHNTPESCNRAGLQGEVLGGDAVIEGNTYTCTGSQNSPNSGPSQSGP